MYANPTQPRGIIIACLPNVQVHTTCAICDAEQELHKARAWRDYNRALYLWSAAINPDHAAYWIALANEQAQMRFQAMTYDEFGLAERKKYLDRSLAEVSSSEYNSQKARAPLLYQQAVNGIEAFCIGNSARGTFVRQYAHDSTSGNHWTKIVDAADTTTWLYMILREGNTHDEKACNTGCQAARNAANAF